MTIAELRKRAGLTQRQLAQKIKVSIPTIRGWERGRDGKRMFEVVARLCEALECSPKDLTGEKDGGS